MVSFSWVICALSASLTSRPMSSQAHSNAGAPGGAAHQVGEVDRHATAARELDPARACQGMESTIVPSMSKMKAPTLAAARSLPRVALGRPGACSHTPCFSEASMNASRSPSSTFCVAEIS